MLFRYRLGRPPHGLPRRESARDGRLSPAVCIATALVLSALFLVLDRDTAAAGQNPISILAPIPFTSTASEYIFIIVSTDGKIETPSVTVNDGPEQGLIRSEAGIHHFRVQLALGLNVIDVKGMLDAEEVRAEPLGIFRTSKIGMRIRSPFPKYVFHTEDAEKKCRECHLKEADADSVEGVLALNTLCLNCHKPLMSEKFVHGPIAVGSCAVCHSFSSEPNKYELNQGSFDLCLLCHVKKAEALRSSEHTHGPLGAALCDICHEPHSSPNFAQLRQPGGEICLVCHKTLDKIFNTKAVLHKPFEQRQCVTCHDPHFSDQAFLLKDDVISLCLSCHEDRMGSHRHPFGVMPRQELPFEARYGKEGELVCVTCHNPHGDDGENMLPGEGCPACHAM